MLNARVVPDVPTFSVDDGFWYSIPKHLEHQIAVGRIVRVPLGGRRVRGWVVELGEGPAKDLKGIASVSGEKACFDDPLLQTLRWASKHYVAPLPVLLNKSTPPNLPRGAKQATVLLDPQMTSHHPLAEITNALAAGRKRPTTVILGPWQALDWLGSFGTLLAAGRSVLIVAATVSEVERISRSCRSSYGDHTVAITSESDAEVTKAWETAQTSARLVVGTPRCASWMIAGLSMVVVLEEGRRAMKDRQTPTIHVRELVRTRALVEKFTPIFFGPTPSVEVLATGADVVTLGNRAWPLVDVVDRREEAPGSGLLAPHSVAAISATVKHGERVFVFVSRSKTDSMVTEINGRLGAPLAAEGVVDQPVIVGRERNLADVDGVGLAIASNPDGMLLGTGYRTSEETLRQLARLANTVAHGTGHRLIIQTFEPDSALVQTMRRGDPIPYLQDVLVKRAREGMPPSTEMIAVEVRGKQPKSVASDLASLTGTSILGPLQIDEGRRWLLTGHLDKSRLKLRELVTHWRAAGGTVRIDSDPIDL